jgi:hypothetical protein
METPDLDAQRRIMAAVADYVSKTIPKLPNFFATRRTIRFEDWPFNYLAMGMVPIRYIPLHVVAESSATVLYRDGREVVDAEPVVMDRKSSRRGGGLSTWGVFGPILGIVLVDAGQSKLSWSHWEQGEAGPLAVFRYQVPQDKSHYEVKWCCMYGSKNADEIQRISGYHGEMAVDPENGAILRLSVIADPEIKTLSRLNEISDLKEEVPISVANMMVEYAPVEVGGKSFICPVKSVSLSRARMPVIGQGESGPSIELGPEKTMLNDVAFGNYHQFRGETRILTEDSAKPDGNQPEP